MAFETLIVNHSDALRQDLVRCLSRNPLVDFTFTEVNHTRRAIDLVTPGWPDVVFLEWHMLTGADPSFVGRLRARRKERIPVVAVVAEDMARKFESGMDCGIDYYVIRPFTDVGLERKLAPFFKQLLAKTRNRDQPVL